MSITSLGDRHIAFICGAGVVRFVARVALALSLIPVVALSQGRGGGGRGQAPPPLQFQMMGPSFGGRVASIAGVPGDQRVWYIGAASGGGCPLLPPRCP